MEVLSRLSKRESEVVGLLLQGKSNKMIAAALGIAERTVEFHLKNIYVKCEVSSRVELILKLGSATGKERASRLWSSTVDRVGENAENWDAADPGTDRRKSVRDTVSRIGKEIDMRNLVSTKEVPAGALAAILAGSVWLALLRRFGHASLDSILPWVLPLLVVWIVLGGAVGLTAKRNGNTPVHTFFSALFGTGAGAVAMLPLTALIILPLGKLVEWLGLVDRAAMPENVTTAIVYIGMMAMWLIVGIGVGTALLYVTLKKPGRGELERPATERGI